MPLLPYQRREVFLEAIKNKQAAPLDPNNREELFLKAIADNVHGTTPGVPVVFSHDFCEKLINLPEAHTHTERYYREILGTLLVGDDYVDTDPYLIRGTADHHPVSGDARLVKLGNTVCVNQLAEAENTHTARDVIITKNADGSVTLNGTSDSSGVLSTHKPINAIVGHKYLMFTTNSALTLYTSIGGSVGIAGYAIREAIASGDQDITIRTDAAVTYNNVKSWVIVIDLSLWFGSTANIPSHLLSHPENWGRYYAGSLAYDAGHLETADGSVLKSIGRNVWKEEWEQGRINSSTGADVASTSQIRSKGFTEIIPNTDYYFYNGGIPASLDMACFWYDRNENFISNAQCGNLAVKSPADAKYVRFYMSANYGASYKNDITISLYYPGESGYDQYYPYTVLAEVDTGSEVLQAVDKDYRDIKLPSGLITHNVKKISVTEFSGTWGATDNGYAVYITVSDRDTNLTRNKVRSNRFIGSYEQYAHMPVYTVGGGSGISTTITFILPSTVTSLAEANTWLTNNPTELIYPVATPTTEQGTPYSPTYGVEYGGEESWLNTNGIPQGHQTTYMELHT